MEQSAIYGEFRPVLEQIKDTLIKRITDYTADEYEKPELKFMSI